MFRIADPEEISKPQRFKHLYRDSKWMKRTHITAVASTILGRDETDERLCTMRDTQECLNQVLRKDYLVRSMNRVRDEKTP